MQAAPQLSGTPPTPSPSEWPEAISRADAPIRTTAGEAGSTGVAGAAHVAVPLLDNSAVRRRLRGLRYYKLASAELHTVTNSVDGFSGLTRGSVFATWINDNGEQHVLKADFILNAVLGDARAHA